MLSKRVNNSDKVVLSVFSLSIVIIKKKRHITGKTIIKLALYLSFLLHPKIYSQIVSFITTFVWLVFLFSNE